MDSSRSKVPLYRFFAGLAEYTFEARLGVADPPLVDYLAELLTRFVHCDAIFNIRNLAGRRLEEVAEMLVEAGARAGDPRREVHRHIGDFTLFWTGVYPEALERFQRETRKDHLIDYRQQGKRSYLIASSLGTSENADESDLLQRLSHEFELCAYGLGELRREWERREPEAPDSQRPWIIE